MPYRPRIGLFIVFARYIPTTLLHFGSDKNCYIFKPRFSKWYPWFSDLHYELWLFKTIQVIWTGMLGGTQNLSYVNPSILRTEPLPPRPMKFLFPHDLPLRSHAVRYRTKRAKKFKKYWNPGRPGLRTQTHRLLFSYTFGSRVQITFWFIRTRKPMHCAPRYGRSSKASYHIWFLINCKGEQDFNLRVRDCYAMHMDN